MLTNSISSCTYSVSIRVSSNGYRKETQTQLSKYVREFWKSIYDVRTF